jgi:hypothetical protein
MLYYSNLEEIIMNRHQVMQSDELVILSGYVGPNPISRLRGLPLRSIVIYGMYGSDGIRRELHQSLVELNRSAENLQILYSNVPVHSKCYVWKFNNGIVHALIGSANFSSSGLSTPHREVLAETTYDTFEPLNNYLRSIIANSIDCEAAVVRERRQGVTPPAPRETEYCRMTLLDPRTNEVPDYSGLNWGQGYIIGHHTRPNDAYIPIRAEYIRQYPELFPPKQTVPLRYNGRGRAQRNNDYIEIIWDDGTNMEGLMEGNYELESVVYPKQISSFPVKSIMGSYIRRRIGVPDEARITRQDLVRYGRTHIDVSLQSERVYYFDFSV